MQLKTPYKLNFAVTYKCQSRCSTCNIWKMKPIGELSLDDIVKFSEANTYFKWVELTGGEPFLREDIDKIAAAFAKNCKDLYVLTIPTNSLCNHAYVENKLKNILELDIPRVFITLSLDGYRELHDKIRGVPGNYDKVIDMYKILQELKKSHKNLSFIFGYTISRLNEGQLDETIKQTQKILPGLKYNDFHINLAQVSGNYYNNVDNSEEILVNDPIVIEDIKKFYKNKIKEFSVDPAIMIDNAFTRKLIYYAATGKSPMKSRSAETSIFVDSYGNVFPSIMWNYKLGNIKDYSFDLKKILENEHTKEALELQKKGKAPDQWTACEAYQSLVGDAKRIIL
ncbi:MAG: radical SAM protein [Candidatus Micrarchaeia archaeon]